MLKTEAARLFTYVFSSTRA